MHSNPAVHQHVRQWKRDRDNMEFVNPAWVMDDGVQISREELESVLDKLVVDQPIPAGHFASHLFEDPDALELYLDHYPTHANIRAKGVTETPLMTQGIFGRVECVKVLLKRGAYPFATDYRKQNALIYAKRGYDTSAQPIIIKLLEGVMNDWDKKCHKCKKEVPKLSKCGGCKMVYYCGRDCQSSHWKSVHRYLCKTYPQLTVMPESGAPSEDCRIC